MVILRKLDTRHLDIAAYEQYGMHPSPKILTTCDWARRAEALANHEANMLARKYSRSN